MADHRDENGRGGIATKKLLQELEADAELLKKNLEDIEKAETVSAGCNRVLKSIQALEGNDSFLLSPEGGETSPNKFHSAPSQAAVEQGGCCVVQ